MSPAPLKSLFAPRSVVLVGASSTPGSLGTVVLANLRAAGFAGPLYLVNPRHAEIGGTPCYPSVRDVPGAPDLAIVVTPSHTVADVVGDCGERGVRGVIVMSAGFREAGDGGRALERAVVDRARRYGLRILGPNCLGVIRTSIGFNGTFSGANALPGRIGLISQSGALCTAILDWARANGVGFSSVISTGIGADVDFGEMLDFLALDPETDSIMLYIEGIHRARPFMSALRAASRVKPVVVMKAGRHDAGSRAALSHTGALVGADRVFAAALRRAGVVRVVDFADFFSTAATLDSGLHSAGRRLAIVTNAGGPGVMAADHAADQGLDLPALAPATLARLATALPRHAACGNPVDVLGDADAARYTAAVTACLDDPGIDGVIAILTPQAVTGAGDVARALLAAVPATPPKPLLTCWMGEPAVAASRDLFRDRNVPTYRTPEAAVAAFAALSAWDENQRQLLAVPAPLTPQPAPDVDSARAIIDAALAEGRKVLTLPESKAVLAAFRIPIVPSLPARTAADAATVAQELGFPVAMKILSPDITHKTDVGGVRLGVADARAAHAAFTGLQQAAAAARPEARLEGVTVEPMVRRQHGRELMVGVVHDEVFGPAISVGLGGVLVELLADSAVALPPLNRELAGDLLDRSRAGRYLGPFRGAPAADRRAVEDLLLRVSEMICELPGIGGLDLNPVVADEHGVTVVDARIVLHHANPAARPYEHLAIHPYPQRLARTVVLPGNRAVTIRPIRPEDAVVERAFVRGLSEQSRYLRFMYAVAELTPVMLARFTQIDYDREMALIAVVADGTGEREIGVSRYTTLHGTDTCEFAIVIADDWQGSGLARQLLAALIDVAREQRLAVMQGVTLATNGRMLKLARALGFEVRPDPEDDELMAMRLEL
ncbi:MAG: bifunctional acetate--CoA ligase family protein/GNAT family N-acetyltransferase [Chromatiales bacterium]|nr:bifunctional acetate--CoA ligase family protein/GNAT family N-acetyltransferase [Chromatiales bacterium]